MSRMGNAIYEINAMETLAARDQWMNHIHPLVKFILTVGYIAVVVSFPKYDLIGLLAMVVYPIAGFLLAELSFKKCLRRLRVVLPLVCVVGLANPFFDRTAVWIGGVCVRAGVISMLTLMLKGIFAVLASYLLVATTTLEQICYALQLLHVPRIIVTQLLLTGRYLTLLLAEVNRTTQAYALRAPNQKGVHYKVWGSLTGQLLLRSIDRANELYESMTLRGYTGDFGYLGAHTRIRWQDLAYLVIWCAVFAVARKVPVILWVGRFITGV